MLKTITCSNEVDYSQVAGDRILPFIFTLDLANSILEPEEGQRQTFCYTVTANGRDTSQFADLSHFLLGICSRITQSDIVDVTVTINGKPQTVIWGENVELKTAEHPDNPTGCAGLKFDFPLDKVDGVMEVCFSLLTPYPVGPVNVCVFGENETATGLSICGPSCGESESCDSTFFQTETVCVPVTVTPFANPGMAKATCCGDPVVTSQSSCPGTRTSCTFTITQKLCIEIPISFGANIRTGTATVQCGDVSEEECDCSDDESVTPEPVPTAQTATEARNRRFFGN